MICIKAKPLHLCFFNVALAQRSAGSTTFAKNRFMSTPTVILVDDDQAVRNSLKFSLELEGFAVEAYSSPENLLAKPDLPECGCLVLDFKLPEMNGLQLLKELRLRKVWLPALLITSNPSLALRQQASAAGVQVVEKPLLGDTLVEGIHSALTNHAKIGNGLS